MKVVFRTLASKEELFSTSTDRDDGTIPRKDEKLKVGEMVYTVHDILYDHDRWAVYVELVRD